MAVNDRQAHTHTHIRTHITSHCIAAAACFFILRGYTTSAHLLARSFGCSLAHARREGTGK